MALVAGSMSSCLHLHHHLTTISKPTLSLLLTKPYPKLTLISCSLSSTSTSTSTPTPSPLPWIVRGKDRNLKLQSHPAANVTHAHAGAKTQSPRKKWKAAENPKREGGPPRLSKAARRYIAVVEGDVKKRQLLAINDGTIIEGVHCTPDFVLLLPSQPGSSRQRLRIVIQSLKQVRIGGYRLPSDLGIGKHLELKPADLKSMGWKG